MDLKKVLVVFGTRPEAIKMAPVVKRLQKSSSIEVKVCVTAQHRGLLDQVLNLFDIRPDYDLDAMRPNQTLADLNATVMSGVAEILRRTQPSMVLVHGDTTTTFAASLACFYQKIPVGHVEAGLRTGNLQAPWPEEMNRRFTGQLASMHFAPTAMARDNLRAEGVACDSIWVTGNTVIDALSEIVQRIALEPSLVFGFFEKMPYLCDHARRTILVTGHRRENFGDGMENVCRALRRIALCNDVDIVYPVHPNPNVMEPVYRLLDGIANIHLVQPMDYLPFVHLMSKSHFIITDSGGIQEEAPSLGKPVLVMRETTERPEAITAGTVRLVGVSEDRIVAEAQRLLNDPSWYASMSAAHNPYGDGLAAERISQIIEGGRNIHEFI